MTQRDCPSSTGASKITMPSFIATIRLLAEPPTTWLNIRRQLDQLEAAVLRVVDLVAVEEAAEKYAPQHPLMGRFAGGRLGLGLDFLADGEGIGRYGGIERDLLQDQPL